MAPVNTLLHNKYKQQKLTPNKHPVSTTQC